jgi:hypothetical protein
VLPPTSRECVADAKESSGKVWRKVGEAAEVAAGQRPVEEHPDAEEADGIGDIAPKGSWGKREHLSINWSWLSFRVKAYLHVRLNCPILKFGAILNYNIGAS